MVCLTSIKKRRDGLVTHAYTLLRFLPIETAGLGIEDKVDALDESISFYGRRSSDVGSLKEFLPKKFRRDARRESTMGSRQSDVLSFEAA